MNPIPKPAPKCPTPRCGHVREARDPFCPECWKRIDCATRQAFHRELRALRERGQKKASQRYVELMIECIKQAVKNTPSKVTLAS